MVRNALRIQRLDSENPENELGFLFFSLLLFLCIDFLSIQDPLEWKTRSSFLLGLPPSFPLYLLSGQLPQVILVQPLIVHAVESLKHLCLSLETIRLSVYFRRAPFVNVEHIQDKAQCF